MKKLLVIILGPAALCFFGGCATYQKEVAKLIPPGNYQSINATVTGKFSATQFTAEHVTIQPDGQMTGGHVHVRHSNIYVPLIEVDVQSEPVAPPISK